MYRKIASTYTEDKRVTVTIGHNAALGEYRVRLNIDGADNPESDYYTTDKSDAFATAGTMRNMARQKLTRNVVSDTDTDTKLARVVEHKLSDGSMAHNVVIYNGGGDEIATIGALGKNHAAALVALINDAAWAE